MCDFKTMEKALKIAWVITKLSHILNKNCKDFFKWHEVALKFNLNVPYTKYYGLVNAIQKEWKAFLKNPISKSNTIMPLSTT